MLEHGMMRHTASGGGINDSKTKVYQLNSSGNYGRAIDGTYIATETTFNPSATNTNDAVVSGNNYSTTTGYLSGGWGYDSNYLCGITYGIRYATDTTLTFGSLITAHTYGGRGINFKDAGYTAGGGSDTSPSTIYSFVQKTTFATDVVSHTATGLPTARCITVGTTDYVSGVGYFLGGYAVTSSITKFTLTTEVTVDHSSSLTNAVYCGGGMESTTAGYVFGGYNGGYRSTVERISFATGTTSVISATVNNNTYTTAGGSSSKFILYTILQGEASPIQKLDPTTDTIASTSIVLSEARASPYCCNA